MTVLAAGIPSPAWSYFQIGPLRVHAYALCILVGIAVALWLTSRRWRSWGGDPGVIADVAIWAVPAGIIGGRIYHVITTPALYFGADGDPALIPQIWRGGLGIWGAVALGTVGAWIGCRRSKVSFVRFLDAAAPGVLIAQGIGRWGNWFNQELFGAPTTLPWGLRIDPDNANFPAGYPADTLFQPTFLYESLWCVLGALGILWAERRFRLRGGQTFWLYVCVYTAGRVWIEMLRIDYAEHFLGVRLNVWTSIVAFLIGYTGFLVARRTRARQPEPLTVGEPDAPARTPDGQDSAPEPGATTESAESTEPTEPGDPDERDPRD